MVDLFWHCAHCGNHEIAHAPHCHGDKDPCTHCGKEWKVMTLKEAAKLEQSIALGTYTEEV